METKRLSITMETYACLWNTVHFTKRDIPVYSQRKWEEVNLNALSLLYRLTLLGKN